ncbi:hypothetical protein J113_22220 [Mycobacterium tuberculosis CAS/NITR204]|uniref:Uncharacterized protein n=1 Tax=Mycobacterium tuberculosis CAS/NITR204 TaxID=1310114 RepID=R4MCN5_MYCTX|nr:hypothetical protein J113_22220 [Mycobacterium tuberculosis CAS/NITR204]
MADGVWGEAGFEGTTTRIREPTSTREQTQKSPISGEIGDFCDLLAARPRLTTRRR